MALVNVADFPGQSIEWVREDTKNMFPLVREDLSNQVLGTNISFQLSKKPVVSVDNDGESVILTKPDMNSIEIKVDGRESHVSYIDGLTGVVKLTIPPPLGSVVTARYRYRALALAGYYGVEMVDESHFVVDPLITKNSVPLTYGTAKGTYIFFNMDVADDDFSLIVDETILGKDYYTYDSIKKTVTFLKKPGPGAFHILSKSLNRLLIAGTEWTFFSQVTRKILKKNTSGFETYIELPDEKPLESSIEIYLDHVPIFRSESLEKYAPRQSLTFSVENRKRVNFSRKLLPNRGLLATYLYYNTTVRDNVPVSEVFAIEGSYKLSDTNILSKTLEVRFNGHLLSKESGDFSFDSTTNEISFNLLPQENDIVTASYMYVQNTLGPFEIKPYQYNNEVIPGVILSFGKRLTKGDKQMVIVFDKRDVVADEFGGKFNLSFDVTAVALDPIQQEEIADLTYMFLLSKKQMFDSEGLALEEVSMQGESEQVYEDNTTEQMYMANLSVKFVTDWHIRNTISVKLRDIHVVSVEQYYLDVFGEKFEFKPRYMPMISNIFERIM